MHQLLRCPQCLGQVHRPAQSSFCLCPLTTMCLLCAQRRPHSIESCPEVVPRGNGQGPKLQDPVMNPLEDEKWEPRGEDLIQGGEASGRELGRNYPDAKGWEGCPKEREQHRKRSGDESRGRLSTRSGGEGSRAVSAALCQMQESRFCLQGCRHLRVGWSRRGMRCV